MTQADSNGEVLILTGMSGAGRSTAANALEDQGWYVVDNLPPQMLKPFIELASLPEHGLERVACVVDVRGGQFFDHAREAILELGSRGGVTVVFLDSSDDVLVRRFEQVRRPHPLQADGTILNGIHKERELMRPIRERADVIIDSTDLNVHQLTHTVGERFTPEGTPGIALTLLSFGYKYGLPTDADMVWDMRFLQNPYWSPELKDRTGLDLDVQHFVLDGERARGFIDSQLEALRAVLSGYGEENKRFATLAIGCTGGRHRSVSTAEAIGQRLSEWSDVRVSVKHRDVGRE